MVKYYYFSVVMCTPLTLTNKTCAEIIKRGMLKSNMFVTSNIFSLLIHIYSVLPIKMKTRVCLKLFMNISIRILQACTNNGSNKAIVMSAI